LVAVSGGAKGALSGAFTGLVFLGVGQWANALEKAGNAAFAADGVGRAFLHGMAGGVLSELQGGEFGHGFLSAGIAKGISARVDLGSDWANGALAALVGGTVSEMTGDKFANGAVTAAMAYAFNHLIDHYWKSNGKVLSDYYVARVDKIPQGDLYEIHVYEDNANLRDGILNKNKDLLKKAEIGVMGPDGNWINKHGKDDWQEPKISAQAQRSLQKLVADFATKRMWLPKGNYSKTSPLELTTKIRAGMNRTGSLQYMKYLRGAAGVALPAASWFHPSPDRACNLGIAQANNMQEDLCGN